MHQRKLVHLQKLLFEVILACAQIFLLQSISCISASAHGTHHWEDDCPSSKFPYFTLFVMFPQVRQVCGWLWKQTDWGVTSRCDNGTRHLYAVWQCDKPQLWGTTFHCKGLRQRAVCCRGDGEYSHRCGQEPGYISVQSGDLPFFRFLLTCASQWALMCKSTFGIVCAF